MKHITTEYGKPCSHIESTLEEFYVLKNFLELHGVEARLISISGIACTWQIKNDYKNWVHLIPYKGTCKRIIDIVEENISHDVYSSRKTLT